MKFARAHDLLLAVRGGGHSLSGQSVCDGGLMIDLSLMKSVRADPLAKTARVEPGVLLGQFDREAQALPDSQRPPALSFTPVWLDSRSAAASAASVVASPSHATTSPALMS